MRLLIILVLVLSFAAGSAQNSDQYNEKFHRDNSGDFIVEVGDALPTFTYVTADGDTLDSDFLRSGLAIVQFTAAWCPFGKLQMEAVQKQFWQEHSENSDVNCIVFHVDIAEDTALFTQIIQELGVSYEVSLDGDERIFNCFLSPKSSVPRLIVANNGVITHLSSGFNPRQFRRLIRKINSYCE